MRPEQVDLSFEKEHNRKEHPKDQIEECWEVALAKNPRLFDGSKFRLQKVSFDKDAKLLRLQLGLTSYKEYLGTNRLDEEKRQIFRKDGIEHFGDEAAFFSNALGCEAALCTSDQQLVLLRRSGAVGTHSGLYNGPSGHPEPKNAGIRGSDDFVATEPLLDAVKREIFQSALDEVVAETGVPLETLSEPLLMGFMADPALKPDVLFLVRTSLDSTALREGISKAQEAWESDRLVFWPLANAGACDLPLTAVTRAALQCLRELPSE
mgnify:FL=1